MTEQNVCKRCGNRRMMQFSGFSASACSAVALTIFVIPWMLSRMLDSGQNFEFDYEYSLRRRNPAPCDYTKGRWVYDENIQLPYNHSCSLAGGYKCLNLLTGESRNDTHKFWRWESERCNVTSFDVHRFAAMLHAIKRRRKERPWRDFATIALIGDSLGQNMWASLVCLINGQLGVNHGHRKEDHFDIVEWESIGVRLTFWWAPYLIRLQSNDSDTEIPGVTDRHPTPEDPWWELHVDRLSQFWAEELPTFDLVVLDSGHWWVEDKLEPRRIRFAQAGIPQPEMKLEEAFEHSMDFVSDYFMNMTRNNSFLGEAFFRDYSPDHFLDGAWNSGGRCSRDLPLTDEQVDEYRLSHVKMPFEALNRVYNRTSTLCPNCNLHMLRIKQMSDSRVDAHPSNFSMRAIAGSDCMHWCLPGVPDTWNDLLSFAVEEKLGFLGHHF